MSPRTEPCWRGSSTWSSGMQLVERAAPIGHSPFQPESLSIPLISVDTADQGVPRQGEGLADPLTEDHLAWRRALFHTASTPAFGPDTW
jgi:hypothetical protein